MSLPASAPQKGRRLRYSAAFERYLFGDTLSAIPAGVVTASQLRPGKARGWCEELSAELPLVLRLTASWRRCSIELTPELGNCAEQFRSMPVDPAALAQGASRHFLVDICKEAFGQAHSIHVSAGAAHYCTARSLRRFDLEGLVSVTARNVGQVAAFLNRGEFPPRPDYMLAHGPAYAWYAGGLPRGFAGVHRSRMMDRVGNVGMVFVDEGHRRRGVGKALVSAVASDLLAAGRVPLYGCSAENVASIALARSVGFLLRGHRCRIMIGPAQT